MVFSDDLDDAVHYSDPIVDSHADVLRNIGGEHRELWADDLVEFRDGHLGAAFEDVGGVPERFAGVGRAPVEGFAVVELVAELEAHDAALGRQFLEERFGDVARDVVDQAQAVVGGHDGVRAGVDGLRHRFVRGMGDVDHHAEPVHFPDEGAAVIGEAVVLRRGTAGVGVVAGPVVGRELDGAQPEAVHLAEDRQVAIEIEAALNIENGCDFAAGADAVDIGGVAGELDRGRVAGDLVERGIEHPKGLLGLETGGVVIFRHKEGEEHRAEAAFFGAGEVELAVGFTLADIAAMVEDAVDGMNVGVEDEGAAVKRGGG